MVSGLPPLRRRYDLALRKVETYLDMKTACEMSAKSTNGRSENRKNEGLAPISTRPEFSKRSKTAKNRGPFSVLSHELSTTRRRMVAKYLLFGYITVAGP